MTSNPTTAPVATTAAEALKACRIDLDHAIAALVEKLPDEPWLTEKEWFCGLTHEHKAIHTVLKELELLKADAQQPQPVTLQSDEDNELRILADKICELVTRNASVTVWNKPAAIALISAHCEAYTANLRAEVARLRGIMELIIKTDTKREWYSTGLSGEAKLREIPGSCAHIASRALATTNESRDNGRE